MKTAEEYIPDSMSCADVWRNVIREIQLDAMREGMRIVAEEIYPEGNPIAAKVRILAIAEQLTEKDL